MLCQIIRFKLPRVDKVLQVEGRAVTKAGQYKIFREQEALQFGWDHGIGMVVVG